MGFGKLNAWRLMGIFMVASRVKKILHRGCVLQNDEFRVFWHYNGRHR